MKWTFIICSCPVSLQPSAKGISRNFPSVSHYLWNLGEVDSQPQTQERANPCLFLVMSINSQTNQTNSLGHIFKFLLKKEVKRSSSFLDIGLR